MPTHRDIDLPPVDDADTVSPVCAISVPGISRTNCVRNGRNVGDAIDESVRITPVV
jgi:hypothetical protein